MNTKIRMEAFLLPLLLGVSLAISACGDRMRQATGDPQGSKSDGNEVAGPTLTEPSVESTVAPEVTLPVLSLA